MIKFVTDHWIIISCAYLVIGYVVATVEFWLNSGESFAYYDIIKILFWLPLMIFPSIDKRLIRSEMLQKPVFK